MLRQRLLVVVLGIGVTATILVGAHIYARHDDALPGPPCGGEALSEDALAQLGRAADSAADHRPQHFIPDPTAFAAIVARTGARERMAQVTTNFSHASPSQAANIALVAARLNGMVIAPGQVFSYIRATGPFTATGGYGWGRMFVGNRIVPSIGGGVCQGASTLYNVVLLSNLPVLERHTHGLTVPYLPPGTDATVSDDADLDLRFRNNTGGPIVLWAQAKDRLLTIAAYGIKKPPQVTIHTEVLGRKPFGTVYIDDRQLPLGTQKQAAPGQDGVTAHAWVTVTKDGKTTTMDLGTATYRPSPRIILRGTGPLPPSAASRSA